MILIFNAPEVTQNARISGGVFSYFLKASLKCIKMARQTYNDRNLS